MELERERRIRVKAQAVHMPHIQEARIVNVMVKVMVREKQVVNLRRMQPRLHQLVSSGRTAVKHQLRAVNINNIRRPEPRRSGRARAEDVE